MAESKKIEIIDIINIEEAVLKLAKLQVSLEEFQKSQKAILVENSKVLKSAQKTGVTPKNITEVNGAIEKSKKITKEIEDASARQKKIEVEKIKLQNELIKQQNRLNLEKEKEAKLIAKSTAENQKANSIYSQTEKRLKEVRNAQRELQIQQSLGVKLTKEQEIELKKLTDEALNLSNAIKQTNESTGQFNGNVGDYKNKVKEALQESGLFGGKLSDLTGSLNKAREELRNVKENLNATAEGFKNASGFSEKFKVGLKGIGNIAKGGGLLLLVGALSSLGAFFTKTQEGINSVEVLTRSLSTIVEITISRLANFGKSLFDNFNLAKISLQLFFLEVKKNVPFAKDYSSEINALTKEKETLQKGIDGAKSSFAGYFEEVGKGIERTKELVRLEQLQAAQLLKRKTEIEDLILEEEDLQRNADAVASSLKDRIENEEKLAVVKEKRIGKENELDKQALQNARTLASIQTGFSVAEIERLTKLAEAKGTFTLKDIENLKALELAEKQSADALDDIQIESKQKLEAINQKNRVNEIKDIQRQSKFKKDAILKDAKTEEDALNFRLQSNEELIKSQERFQVLTEEKIDIDKLATIEDTNQYETALLNLRLSEKATELLRDTVALRKEDLQTAKDLEQKIAENEKKRLEELEKRDKEALNRRLDGARDEVIAELEKNGQLKKARQNAIFDLEEDLKTELSLKEYTKQEELEIDDKYRKKRQEINEKYDSIEKKQNIEQIEKLNNSINTVFSKTNQELEKINAEKLDRLDKQINDYNQAIQDQQELANKGVSNTLDFEIKARDEAILKKKEQEQRARREAEVIESVSKFNAIFINAIKKDNANVGTALAEASTGTLASDAIAKSLAKLISGASGFFEGSENIGKDLAGAKLFNTGRDDYFGMVGATPIRLHGQERIVQGQLNRMIQGVSNEKLVHGYLQNQKGTSDYAVNELKELIRKVQINQVSWDSVGNLIRKEVKENITLITKFR